MVGIIFGAIIETEALIFFAPNKLTQKIIFFGNYINLLRGKKVLIIVNDKQSVYQNVQQLFKFIVNNSTRINSSHSLPWLTADQYIKILFHKGQPLDISCGKTAYFLKNILVKYLNFDPTQIRYVDMWSKASLSTHAVTQGYLSGGHTSLEIYLKELDKWIVLDGWFGIIPKKNGIPLSMLEISQLPDSEINFKPLGKDKLGKGKGCAEVNNYYRDGKKIFGYRDNWMILFLRSTDKIAVFREHFNKSYKKKCKIFTDSVKFGNLIGNN